MVDGFRLENAKSLQIHQEINIIYKSMINSSGKFETRWRYESKDLVHKLVRVFLRRFSNTYAIFGRTLSLAEKPDHQVVVLCILIP